MKNIIEKSCTFTNLCNKPTLCCNYCKEKGCTDRCNDNKDSCKYLIDFISKQDLDKSRNRMSFTPTKTAKKQEVKTQENIKIKEISEIKKEQKSTKKVVINSETKNEEKELLW